jgi:transposase
VRPLRVEAMLVRVDAPALGDWSGRAGAVRLGRGDRAVVRGARGVARVRDAARYSRRGFAMTFEHERMPDLLAAHEAAFAYFGGRREQMRYDRMLTVVLGGKARLNATFAAFPAHWGFTARLCQPYPARTKCKVESGVKHLSETACPAANRGNLRCP